MIVLKHLAREFDLDPYRLRQILRAHNVKTTNGRYTWPEKSKQLAKVRLLLSQHGKTTATGHTSTTR